MSENRHVEEITPEEARRLRDEGKAVIIDVREPHEYQAERIHGALLFPLSTFDATALPDDGDRQVILHCGVGGRSMKAAQHCLQSGRPRAAHITGGLKAWKEGGLPTVSVDPRTGQVVDNG
jgi:rhodanese-related sulfurtransferase